MRNRVLYATIAALSVSAATISPVIAPAAGADEKTAKISISNITDFHGRFEYVEDTKKPEKSIPDSRC